MKQALFGYLLISKVRELVWVPSKHRNSAAPSWIRSDDGKLWKGGFIRIEGGIADPRGRCGIAMLAWYPNKFPNR
ncbi:hypothetical protein ARALYDRAFT_906039 [Arabidopsis lyrata subsp. lyrata]|uniref:Uncharacterized protein n=1 Tax=Arabidopsis lyrata subsp. lyrata TaxID=81972 RepID=D7LRI2_ARALL|nr:hypothetical protein ARALYDRAFT_906039 [Arabidopsis lyrata subsp. lyrata]